MKRMNHRMGMWALGILGMLLLIAGCVAKVPLSDIDNAVVDPKLIGLWETKDGDDTFLLAIAPFDKHGYLLTYRKVSKKEAPAIWRAWLTKIGGKDFYTVDIRAPYAALQADADKDTQAYLIGTWSIDGQTLKLTGLDVEKHKEIKDVATTDALHKLVAEHVDDATFFKDLAVYKKVPADRMKASMALMEQE